MTLNNMDTTHPDRDYQWDNPGTTRREKKTTEDYLQKNKEELHKIDMEIAMLEQDKPLLDSLYKRRESLNFVINEIVLHQRPINPEYE